MSLFQWKTMLGLVALLAVLPEARAQQRQQSTPRIGYVYPAGGRQGTVFQVTVGGRYLGGVDGATVSGAGVQATLAAEIRKNKSKLVKQAVTPAIAETVTLQIKMAPDAEPGQREIRLKTSRGFTNPLVFCVGQWTEFSEKAAETASKIKSSTTSKYREQPKAGTAKAEPEITLPAIVNGQITPGDVDRYRFEARRGQQLVAAVSARRLIPYLADAVPGWFQATLAVYDAQGHELAYDDDFRFDPDPVLHCEIPADGEYVIEIKDAIYRGREDFVYRITVGELPLITGIFPLGGPAGAKTNVELQGFNLPVTRLTIDEQADSGIYPVSVRRGEWVSNRVPFAVDTLPECVEREPNDDPARAQSVTLPIIVNGRIDEPGDRDVFAIAGRTGEEIVAEVSARRLGSPLDSWLKLTDSAGKKLALNDDHEDKGLGLNTHHADSRLTATLPADGTYYLSLDDAQQKGGPEYGYRLRISPPRPDFELRIVPSAINIRGGATASVTVYALRKDGFSDEITLNLKDAPEGFTLAGARVPAGQDQASLMLRSPAQPTATPVTLHVEGSATIQGRTVSHPAVPAEDMMQAFAYQHLVPAQELKVAVSKGFASKSSAKKKGKRKKKKKTPDKK